MHSQNFLFVNRSNNLLEGFQEDPFLAFGPEIGEMQQQKETNSWRAAYFRPRKPTTFISSCLVHEMFLNCVTQAFEWSMKT